MFKNIVPKFWASIVKPINWKPYSRGVMIEYETNNPPKDYAMYVIPQFKIEQLNTMFGTNQLHIQLPEGVTKQSSLIQFLNNPIAQQLKISVPESNVIQVLRNKAARITPINDINAVLHDKKSIFGQIETFMNNCQIKTEINMNNFIIQYYFQLHFDFFCRINSIAANSPLTDNLKQSFVLYLFGQHATNSQMLQTKIKKYISENITRINQIEAEIAVINQGINRRISFYKVGAAIITTIHLVGFGYMIFFVDELGWDIIQPITYTLSCFYLVLGVRFFLKHQTTRSLYKILQALKNFRSTPIEKLKLIQLGRMLQLERKSHQKNLYLLVLAQNKINYRSSLVDQFEQNQIKLSQ